MKSYQKFPLCPLEPMPASSNTDCLLAMAKPISDGDGTSGMTDSSRGGQEEGTHTVQQQLQLEKRSKNM